MTEYVYQKGYSELYSDWMYDPEARTQKAKKIIAVFDDFYSGNLGKLSVLDIGCSTGIITNALKDRFGNVIGIDIDEQAISYAKTKYERDGLKFDLQDSMNLKFASNSFDIVVCAHIYEHVPDSNKLISEICRVLKTGGICYFAAGNRLNVIEPHYRLPLLSILPKPIANLYLRLLRKGNFYYEKHLTLHGLRKLVHPFEIIDYTGRIISDPGRYYATDMIQDRSLKQKIANFVCNKLYPFCPTYIWLLRKVKERV
jgi:2-polyprenyl-3-methyl-5-hydroxy-6-metoxy-1,4-benzoquinol methylase